MLYGLVVFTTGNVRDLGLFYDVAHGHFRTPGVCLGALIFETHAFGRRHTKLAPILDQIS